jgi:isoleucyl-tRNA synthetase
MTTKTKKKTKAGLSRVKPARASKPVAKHKAGARPKAEAKPRVKAKTVKAAAKPASKPKAKRSRAPQPVVKSKAPVRKPSGKSRSPAQVQSRAPKPAATPVVKVGTLLKSPAKPPQTGRDWSATLFLPKTNFPMKAGLPEREPELLKRWEQLRLYERLREEARGRERFILHDGPPYANGHLHIGHSLNKILKDVITRSQQMMGMDANYVPGWDCHGLPIEWKVEEEYRAKGQNKGAVPINEFREVCRKFAAHWIDVQCEEFKRLGVEGDWQNPYTTMTFDAESTIARELMKFAMNGLLYRGSKPVMWSVVEQTALAEAEVEYQEITSPAIYVKFPVFSYSGPALDIGPDDDEFLIPEELQTASIIIWTTTPWTLPGSRAISFSKDIDYGIYEVTHAPDDNWASVGDRLILADRLAEKVFKAARVTAWRRFGHMPWSALEAITAAHPLRKTGYDFLVPLLAGEHVTEDTGTGFVHTAPGHGTEDFEIWEQNRATLEARGIDTTIPFTVDADGFFTKEAPGFEGKCVIDDRGKFGDANEAVIQGLIKANALVGRSHHKHDYPHSWRSKKPVIFRNTPQWFIAMDRSMEGGAGDSLRDYALQAIGDTRFVPPQGENRLRGMVQTKPDWVVSRQRAWGVPITVFRHKETGAVIPGPEFNASGELIDRIVAAFAKEGADAWFKEGAKERFLGGLMDSPDDWEKVDDILDVWFDSGSTHAFVLEQRPDLQWPASLYLEGSDQHRGWFQSSLLESCGTRGRAPYDAVLTHGFVVDEEGRKMSKSSGNVVAPQDVIKQSGAEILRLWAMSSDYAEDLRIGREIIKANVESYRKLRNTLRFLLGNLAHDDPSLHVAYADMPELERYMLSRLAELDAIVRVGYDAFDFKRIFHALFNFCVNDLSAFYFDIRKDALYCDPYDSPTRRASLTVLDTIFEALTAWLAPMLCFTMEEAWLNRFPTDKGSVHLRQFPAIEDAWRDDALAEKWRKVRQVRRVVTGALEIERKERRIGSSLEAAPNVYVTDRELHAALYGIDLAEIAITSGATLLPGTGSKDAFRLDEVPGVAVEFERAEGKKCARSWKILIDVGADPEFPELSPRDAEAVRQFDARQPMTAAEQTA